MDTVGDLVDATQRGFLEPPDELWTRTTLTSGVDDSTLTLPIDTTVLSAEDKHLISAGVLANIGSEEVLLKALDGSDVSVAARGIRGIDAAAHASGTEVVIQPAWTRKTIFDAVADNIVTLHPTLFTTTDTTVEVGVSGITEVPANVVSVGDVRDASNFVVRQFDDLGMWPLGDPVVSTRAIRVFSVSPGSEVHIGYRGRFTRPTSEADLLADLGVRVEWGRIVSVGSAAQLMAGRSLSTAQQRYVTEQLRNENWQAETPSRLTNSLLRYREYLADAARNDLLREHAPTQVQIIGV